MGRRAPNPVRQIDCSALQLRTTWTRCSDPDHTTVEAMTIEALSIKNLMLAAVASMAFVGAIFVAAGPDSHKIDFAMPNQAQVDVARQ